MRTEKAQISKTNAKGEITKNTTEIRKSSETTSNKFENLEEMDRFLDT
jgi:hypothetical protein